MDNILELKWVKGTVVCTAMNLADLLNRKPPKPTKRPSEGASGEPPLKKPAAFNRPAAPATAASSVPSEPAKEDDDEVHPLSLVSQAPNYTR